MLPDWKLERGCLGLRLTYTRADNSKLELQESVWFISYSRVKANTRAQEWVFLHQVTPPTLSENWVFSTQLLALTGALNVTMR